MNLAGLSRPVTNGTHGTSRARVIYLELSKPMEESIVNERIDAQLQGFEKDWRDLMNYLKYDPLRTRLLRARSI